MIGILHINTAPDVGRGVRGRKLRTVVALFVRAKKWKENKMLVEEKAGIQLMKDYSSEGAGGYVYWIAGQEQRVFSYRDALEMFQEAIAASLEPQGGDCPKCGGNLHQVGLGGKWNHRYADSCDSCGWSNDAGTSHSLIVAACEAHGLVKKGAPDHREGRIGVKEAIQFNEDGFDPRFD